MWTGTINFLSDPLKSSPLREGPGVCLFVLMIFINFLLKKIVCFVEGNVSGGPERLHTPSPSHRGELADGNFIFLSVMLVGSPLREELSGREL